MIAENWNDVVAALADRTELHEAWLNGLSYNPSATGSVLRRIITVNDRLNSSSWLEQRELSEESSAVLVRHADRTIRVELTQNPSLSLDALATLGRDPDRIVRELAVESAWHRDRDLHRALVPEYYAADPADKVTPEPPPSGAPLTRAEAQALVTSPDRLVRAHAAWNDRVPQDVALELAEDPDDQVRLYLSMREDLSEEQRAAITYVVPNTYHQVPEWLTRLKDDPQAMAEHACSSHILIRRSAAMARHLPPAAVHLLANDEDFFVKLTLAQYCDDAPHELLIEMFGTWNGLRWSFLRYRPNFIRNGMAADFATHPNPRLRWAALLDPTASVEIVEALSHDPSRTVYPWAVSDPRLPSSRLHEALGNPRTALSAARNPRIPEAVMHQILDYVGLEAL